jgi:hypothetical protein
MDTGALPSAFVGEDYSARISVEGGIPPYQFSISAGQLPAGLHLGSDGIILGTPQSGANSLDYNFTIRVVDNSHYYIEKQFSIMLLYKASIYISNYLNGGETTVIIDDNTKIKARGWQTIEQTFLGGTIHWVKAEPLVQDYSDNLTRFISKQDTIRIDDADRNVTFDYYSEYSIKLVTEPSNAASSFPFDWYRMTDWHKQGSVLTYNVPKTISPYTGVEYRFVNWSLPNGDRQNDSTLAWTVTWPGKVSANYDIYYELKLYTPYGAKLDGNGWYKAGESAPWSAYSPIDQPVQGLLGSLGFKLKPIPSAGTIKMDSPKNYDVIWDVDYWGHIGEMISWIIEALIVIFIAYLIKRFWPKIINFFK